MKKFFSTTCFVITILVLLLLSQSIKAEQYNDVIFNSSFESGNLYNITFVNGDRDGNRLYNANINYSTLVSGEYHWWFFFKMENTSGKSITINITNIASRDITNNRWPNIIPRYSYNFCEGNINQEIPCWNIGNWYTLNRSLINYYYDNITNKSWYSFLITPVNDTVWVAANIPYTVTRRNKFLESISYSDYVDIKNVTFSPNRIPITAVTITDFRDNSSNKTRIYFIGQQHSNEETQGSWVIEGMINFLLNESDPTSEIIRQKYIIKLVPIVNVDGTFSGMGRFTPTYFNETNYTQYDPNREWQKARLNNLSNPAYGVVRDLYVDIGNFSPNISFDLHGSANGEPGFGIPPGVNYYLIDGVLDGVTASMLQNISSQLNYFWPDYTRPVNANAMPPNVRQGFNVHPSINVEWTITNTTAVFIPGVNEWVNDGRAFILGIDSYFTIPFVNTPPYKPNPTLNSSSGRNITTDSIYCSAIINDTNSFDRLSVTLNWFNNGVLNLTSTYYNLIPGSRVTSIINNFSTTKNDIWSCRMRVTDNLNASSDWGYSDNLTILNSPPVLQTINNITVNENQTAIVILNATDLDNDLIIYSVNDSRFRQQSNNTFVWHTNFNEAGVYFITFYAYDGELSDEKTITITVNNINLGPKLLPIDNITINEDDIAIIIANAYDPDNDTLLYSVNDSRFSQNNNVFSWHTTHNDSGEYLVRVLVSDTYLDDYQDVLVVVNDIVLNNPPYAPSNPIPENGSINISTNVIFSWIGGDPDVGDVVKYDLYFGNTSSPGLRIANLTNTTHSITNLTQNTTYYWKIISHDQNNSFTSGPLWQFRTMAGLVCYPYVPGDVNGNGKANGIDVTYFVSYLKGGAAPPYYVNTSNGRFYPAADANGNCQVNGIDVTFLVNYFKGVQPRILYCPDYPPCT
ncbi:MAG: M14 family zinc carboxypeptidase [Candidatus Woesearchaeota archaeon]